MLSFMKERLRETFHDDYQIQWSDALLDEILFEARREYALYSGELTGRFDVFAGSSPVVELPEDFIEVISVSDEKGKDIPVVSFRRLADLYGDFRKIKGDRAKFFCFNFDGSGKARTFPLLPAGTFAGTVVYKKLPSKDLLEEKNISAIEQHALFQMYQFIGKSQAANCLKNFLELTHREQSIKLVTGRKNITRTGVYY